MTVDLSRVVTEEAIARVDEHADKTWKIEAKWALYRTMLQAGVGGTFTTDDVDWPAGTHDDRARGPIMRSAAIAGLIEVKRCELCGTRQTVEGENPNVHRNPTYVWTVVRLG